MALLTKARRWVAPRLRNANWAYREALERRVGGSTRWLDLGCGHQLLPDWMSDGERCALELVQRSQLVVGVDQVSAALTRHQTIARRVNADISCLPFRAESFDLVTANMVLEHVEDGHRLLSEVRRVLVPGGSFLFHTPNRHFYQVMLTLWVPPGLRRRAASLIEKRPAEDVFETRYRMNTLGSLRSMAAHHGFDVEVISPVNSSLTTARLGPLVLLELGVVGLLETEKLAWARSNLVGSLRKRS